MSVSPETAPEDLDQSGTATTPRRSADLRPDEAVPTDGSDEAQADIETAEPSRLPGGAR